jgi:hypothetical protein
VLAQVLTETRKIVRYAMFLARHKRWFTDPFTAVIGPSPVREYPDKSLTMVGSVISLPMQNQFLARAVY